MGDIRIRIAKPEDAAALLKIYAPYVENTAISFEYTTPTVEEFRRRIERTLEKYPFLLAERQGAILGYAYAGAFKERAAYSWSVETTIYLDSRMKGAGLGRRLYEALEAVLQEQGALNMEACIACPVTEEERRCFSSAQFHAHMGYRLVGEFRQSGFKFGRWYNMIWMEKHIGGHSPEPLPFIPFPQIRQIIKEKYDID